MPALLDMGRKFYEAAQPEWPWSDEGFTQTISDLNRVGVVIKTSGGFIAGVAAPMPLSPDWVVAHEVLWWSEDRSGLKLRKAFREWAKEQGANEIKWSCRSDNERVMRFYTKTSKPSESVFSEILPCA